MNACRYAALVMLGVFAVSSFRTAARVDAAGVNAADIIDGKDDITPSVLVPFECKDHVFFNGSLFRRSNSNADFEVTMKRSIEFLNAHGFSQTNQSNAD